MAEATGPFNSTTVSNQCLPGEKPKIMPVIMDFNGVDEYIVNLLNEVQADKIKSVQTLYIDNADGGGDVVIRTDVTNQRIIMPNGWQGYLPVLMPSPPIFTASCLGTGIVKIHMVNVPMPAYIWNTAP